MLGYLDFALWQVRSRELGLLSYPEVGELFIKHGVRFLVADPPQMCAGKARNPGASRRDQNGTPYRVIFFPRPLTPGGGSGRVFFF